jgi:hypothetical protein
MIIHNGFGSVLCAKVLRSSKVEKVEMKLNNKALNFDDFV